MENPRDVLSAYGVPPDAVAAVLREEIEKVAKTSAALDRANQDPFFRQHAPAMAAFLETNEGLRDSVSRIGEDYPDEALDLLRMSYARQTGNYPDQGRQPQRQAPENPGGRATASFNNALGMPREVVPEHSRPLYIGPDRRPTVEEARAAYNSAPTSQNAKAYAKARLDQVISDDFLNA